MKRFLEICLILLSIVVVICLSAKYYVNQSLIFTNEHAIIWTIGCSLIVFSLFIGLKNTSEIKKLGVQNSELKELIVEMANKNDKYHFENLGEFRHSQDITLDILQEITKE